MAHEADGEMCWICLEEAAENGSHNLMSPCKCPRKVHPPCLARWQLQQAGRHEEKFCRFCNNELADWKSHLTPEDLKPEVSKVQPIMVVYFEGQIHRIPVKQGPDGLTEFTTKIRELFRLPEDVDISLTFGCKEPMSGSHLKLEGMGAFDAAVHCASVAAAERQQKLKKSYSTGHLGSNAADNAGHRARSASNNSIPAAGAATAANATAPTAAGLSANAQGRRHRFQGDGQAQQRTARSRSFTVGSTSSSRSAGVEQPAAFRNILNMLGGGGSASTVAPAAVPISSPFAAAAQQIDRSASPSAQAEVESSGASGRVSPLSQAAGAGSIRGSPNQQRYFKKERLSLRNISELTDVPEMDETVAIGSLSGKFKLHLKAFSRKVARSLSFTNKHSGGGAEGNTDLLATATSADLEGSSPSRVASSPTPRVIDYGTSNPVALGSASHGFSPLPPRSASSSPLPPMPRAGVRA